MAEVMENEISQTISQELGFALLKEKRLQNLQVGELCKVFKFLLALYDKDWAWKVDERTDQANKKQVLRYLRLLDVGYLLPHSDDLIGSNPKVTRTLHAVIGKLRTKYGTRLARHARHILAKDKLNTHATKKAKQMGTPAKMGKTELKREAFRDIRQKPLSPVNTPRTDKLKREAFRDIRQKPLSPVNTPRTDKTGKKTTKLLSVQKTQHCEKENTKTPKSLTDLTSSPFSAKVKLLNGTPLPPGSVLRGKEIPRTPPQGDELALTPDVINKSRVTVKSSEVLEKIRKVGNQAGKSNRLPFSKILAVNDQLSRKDVFEKEHTRMAVKSQIEPYAKPQVEPSTKQQVEFPAEPPVGKFQLARTPPQIVLRKTIDEKCGRYATEKKKLTEIVNQIECCSGYEEEVAVQNVIPTGKHQLARTPDGAVCHLTCEKEAGDNEKESAERTEADGCEEIQDDQQKTCQDSHLICKLNFDNLSNESFELTKSIGKESQVLKQVGNDAQVEDNTAEAGRDVKSQMVQGHTVEAGDIEQDDKEDKSARQAALTGAMREEDIAFLRHQDNISKCKTLKEGQRKLEANIQHLQHYKEHLLAQATKVDTDIKHMSNQIEGVYHSLEEATGKKMYALDEVKSLAESEAEVKHLCQTKQAHLVKAESDLTKQQLLCSQTEQSLEERISKFEQEAKQSSEMHLKQVENIQRKKKTLSEQIAFNEGDIIDAQNQLCQLQEQLKVTHEQNELDPEAYVQKQLPSGVRNQWKVPPGVSDQSKVPSGEGDQPELRRAEMRLQRLLLRLEMAAKRKHIMNNMPLSQRPQKNVKS